MSDHTWREAYLIKPDFNCPECGRSLFYRGVMLAGNILTGEELHPVGRWDCPQCMIIVADELPDQGEGWRLWKEYYKRHGGL